MSETIEQTAERVADELQKYQAGYYSLTIQALRKHTQPRDEEIASLKAELELLRDTCDSLASDASENEKLKQSVAELEAVIAQMADALKVCEACAQHEIHRLELNGHHTNVWPDVLTGCVSGGGIRPALEAYKTLNLEQKLQKED